MSLNGDTYEEGKLFQCRYRQGPVATCLAIARQIEEMAFQCRYRQGPVATSNQNDHHVAVTQFQCRYRQGPVATGMAKTVYAPQEEFQCRYRQGPVATGSTGSIPIAVRVSMPLPARSRCNRFRVACHRTLRCFNAVTGKVPLQRGDNHKEGGVHRRFNAVTGKVPLQLPYQTEFYPFVQRVSMPLPARSRCN